MKDPITKLNKALKHQNSAIDNLIASLEAYQQLLNKWAGK